jgi:hypothetical protein
VVVCCARSHISNVYSAFVLSTFVSFSFIWKKVVYVRKDLSSSCMSHRRHCFVWLKHLMAWFGHALLNLLQTNSLSHIYSILKPFLIRYRDCPKCISESKMKRLNCTNIMLLVSLFDIDNGALPARCQECDSTRFFLLV